VQKAKENKEWRWQYLPKLRKRYFGGCALSRISFDPKGVIEAHSLPQNISFLMLYTV